jgi:hypothetical protein
MVEKGFPKKIHVEAYSGYKVNERPMSFFLENQKRRVVDIVDRWYGVENDYFKVLADDGKVYMLRWNRLLDLWTLVKVMERLGKH